jgi:hypothetical protein
VVNQFAGDQPVVLDLWIPVHPLSMDAAAEPGVSVGAGWQGAIKFRVDGISRQDCPSGVGCTVTDSNADGESVDALKDVLSVHQVCESGEVSFRVDVDSCDVSRCQWRDDLGVIDSNYSAEPSGRSVLHWRYDREVAIGRCCSLADHLGQPRSRHDRMDCLMSSVQLYLSRTVGTRRCRGWTRMIFDPGGIGYGLCC